VKRFLLSLYLSLALRTTRWTLHGEAHVAPHLAGAPCIAAFWHERLPLMPALWLRAKRRTHLHVLVSRHRDGRMIGGIMRHFAISAVHGSSSRGGAAALRRLGDLLAGGDQVAITPDGPRGPSRKAAPGVAQLAALSGVPVLPCAAQTSRRLVMKSWDRMVIPLPFGRGVLVCGAPVAVARDGWAAALPLIETALTDAADTADRLCGR